ncbi:hypothetical protein [Amycolatopsis jiangsuensis]|uniref:Uncharacterized protein n=1 Tax=Amycolatopsis jiangsuensis TaxID=1181879 RepID=A0A840ISU6_9PSEU|nr:hypothetical protein [Amycolatopsis jiangsuensis]MBB4684447.1 hypothetical protein [Amycolatopsis jiangsuensis]
MIGGLEWTAAVAFVALLALVLTRTVVAEQGSAGKPVLRRMDIAAAVVVVALVAVLVARVLAEF